MARAIYLMFGVLAYFIFFATFLYLVAFVGNLPWVPYTVDRGGIVGSLWPTILIDLSLVTLFGLALYPNLVTAGNNPSYSLTIYNASSSPGTLKTMLLFAVVGLPFVLVYSALVYRAFRGRVELGDHIY